MGAVWCAGAMDEGVIRIGRYQKSAVRWERQHILTYARVGWVVADETALRLLPTQRIRY